MSQPIKDYGTWVGDSLSTTDGLSHFVAFQTQSSSQVYGLGDYVHLHNTEGPPFPGQIIDLFENRAGFKLVKTRWLAGVDDLKVRCFDFLKNSTG